MHIDDVALGGRTYELFCPFCGNPLIAKKGKVLIHHFAHETNQSCRNWVDLSDYIPPYEGYYVADLSRPQQRLLANIFEEHGTRPFEAEHIRRQSLEALALKRFLDLFDAPYIYRNDNYQRMTRVAKL
ncbi:MAG: hypothetical protein KDE19_13895, partial [Caldilineaceae bacterium]|nr:hypothetical protein [Caldilineaceae bacterium]